MSTSWMVYATCFSLLLAAAAILLERPLWKRGRNTRLLWAATLAVAVVWPVAVAVLGGNATSGAKQPNGLLFPTPLPNGVAVGRATAPVVKPLLVLPAVLPASRATDDAARKVAMLAPLLVLAALLLDLVRTTRARRRWKAGEVDGVPVLLSPDFGPAIVGVLNPAIVLPAWSLGLPPDQRRLMLAHESEHLASHDSQWLVLAFLAVAIAPWNAGIWWLLRRFRLAVEVDCDRRVLRLGHDVRQYGNLLLEICHRSSGRSLLAASFTNRPSMLRARIDIITLQPGGNARSQALRIALGTTVLLAACTLGPSRQRRVPSGTSGPIAATTLYSIVVDTTVVVSNIRAQLDQFRPPATDQPSVTTRFIRDTVRVGEPIELFSVTWFPKALKDSLRSGPWIKSPQFAGLSTASQLHTGARARFDGYQVYIFWQTMSPTSSGRIEVPPAVLSYRVPVQVPFPHEEQRNVQSSPAVLVVRE